MKRNFKFLSLFLCLMLTVFVMPIKANAHTHAAYSHDSDGNVKQDRANWMSGLSDNLTINEISIPGTGNSMSYGNFTDFTLTQSMNLETQLKAGIRFLDVTINQVGDTGLRVVTGLTDLGVDFIDVLETVVDFLKEHQEEIVLIKISEQESESGNFGYSFRRAIENEGLEEYIFDGSRNSNPTLKQARGQVIILSDYTGQKWKSIPYRTGASIQDNNYLNTNWDLYSKWEKVKEHLNKTNKQKNNGTRYINYLTGSGGVFPYFVASGHSSSGTGADRLLTGLTEPGFRGKYPDFPRVGRLGMFASIAFEGTNVLALNYILQEELDFVGIVVADFPGDGLIREIIDLNFKNPSFGNGSIGDNNNSGSGNVGGIGSTTSNNGGWGFTFKSIVR